MPKETVLEKQSLARWVNAQMAWLGLALKCPKTGGVSTLQADTGNDPRVGRFQFYHYQGSKKKITVSKGTLPELEVVPFVTEPAVRDGATLGWSEAEGRRGTGRAHGRSGPTSR
jgi:hypothetical protein